MKFQSQFSLLQLPGFRETFLEFNYSKQIDKKLKLKEFISKELESISKALQSKKTKFKYLLELKIICFFLYSITQPNPSNRNFKCQRFSST